MKILGGRFVCLECKALEFPSNLFSGPGFFVLSMPGCLVSRHQPDRAQEGGPQWLGVRQESSLAQFKPQAEGYGAQA